MIFVWGETCPTWEEFCEKLGYDPDDDSYWENYCEFRNENYPEEAP